MNTKLYDKEDDIIDRGDATNFSEALDYFNIDRVYQHNKQAFDKLNEFNIRIESDYYNHRQTHYDRMNPEYLAKDTCEFTHFKDKLDDRSIADRTSDPNLLAPFRNNPYTQSLESFAY